MWLLVALPIIAFYILKTRLRKREVATLLFWDQLFEEKRQRSLWQNLRHWLSLLLQLLFVGFVGFAIADPLWKSQSTKGQELILVVDNSASMQAVDPESGVSRLEDAIRQANEVSKGLRQGDQIALMTSGSSVRVAVGMTDFAPAIQEALAEIQPTDGPTEVLDAIDAARKLAKDAERRRVIVFTDACLDDREQLEFAEDVRVMPIGRTQDNVAITTFQVRRSVSDPIGYALLVEIQNFGENDVETRLKLQLADALVDVIPIQLAPGETFRKTINGTSREGGVLLGELGIEDALATDNVARAIVPGRPLIPVTLVADDETESFYLRSVFESIPLVKLTDAPNDFDPASAPVNSLTVFSGAVPKSLPTGPTLIVNPTKDGPDGTWKIGESMQSPIIAKQEKSSPLLRHVQLQNVILAGGRNIEINDALGEATTLLETAESSSVLVAVERPAGRVLILAADLESSDLPLRIAFPVMMTNAMNWFFRQSGDMSPAISTGQIASVHWDLGGSESTKQATLVDPNGGQRRVTLSADRVAIGPIEQTGVYGLVQSESLVKQDDEDAASLTPQEQLDGGAKGKLVAINLCDANESDLRIPDVSQMSAGDPPARGSSPWFYLAMLGLGLVVTEWVLFNRRVVA